MTDLVARLRREGENAQSKHLSMGMWQLCDEAADVIEQLTARNAEHEERYSALEALEQIRRDEIERLKTENEQWRKLNSERVDEIAGLIHRLREAATAIERLRAENEQLKIALSDIPRDDGTVVAVGGEPGASAGKSE